MTILGLDESFKNDEPADHNANWRPISRKVKEIETWNFSTTFQFAIDIFYSLETIRFSAP